MNGLSKPIKRQRLSGWIKNTCQLLIIYRRNTYQTHKQIKNKLMGKDTSCKQQLQESQSSYTNTKKKQTFKKCYQRQRHFMIIERQQLIEMKGEIDNSTRMVEDCKILLLIIDKNNQTENQQENRRFEQHYKQTRSNKHQQNTLTNNGTYFSQMQKWK